MRRMALFAAAAALAFVGACSGGTDVEVTFLGQTPPTSKAKDTRNPEFRCPACRGRVEPGAAKCAGKGCGSKLRWGSGERACGYCRGTGKCATCALMNQADGGCYACRASGYLEFGGQAVACANCGGSKKCPICKGKQECDFCGGDGRVPLEELQSRAKAPQAEAPGADE